MKLASSLAALVALASAPSAALSFVVPASGQYVPCRAALVGGPPAVSLLWARAQRRTKSTLSTLGSLSLSLGRPRDAHTRLTESTAVPEIEAAHPITRKAAQAEARSRPGRVARGKQSPNSSSSAGREDADDEPLLQLLARAFYHEAIAPVLQIPVRGTRTLQRLPAKIARRGGLKNWLSIDELAASWFDFVCSQPLAFLPSELPAHLINRKVTRVQLGSARFQYIEQYDVVKELGEGSTGNVLQVRDSASGDVYAVKVLNKKMLRQLRYGNHNLLKNVETEIAAMLLLGHHPNLLKLYEVMDAGDCILLRLEYCGGGQTMGFDSHLFSCLATWYPPAPSSRGFVSVAPLDEHTARCYFSDLISGLDYIHQQNMVHR